MVSILLVVFVNFMFSNSVFMHLHKDASGHSFLHSHPYLPKTAHSHSSQSLDLVNAFNVAASSAQCADAPMLSTQAQLITILFSAPAATAEAPSSLLLSLRAPPAK